MNGGGSCDRSYCAIEDQIRYDLAMTVLDITSLRYALQQLQLGMNTAKEKPADELVRDGVIYRFKYSHELALKFIKRVLETVHGDSVDQMAYNDLLRTAAEREYIENVEQWFEYRKARNQTSHAYDAQMAALVFTSAEPFLQSARFLLQRLEERAA